MMYGPAVAKVTVRLFLTASLLMPLSIGSCAGGSWRLLKADEVSDGLAIFGLVFLNADHGWVLTASELLETTDGGGMWTARLASEGAERSFDSLLFISPTTGFIVGVQHKSGAYTALILRTVDGGVTWEEPQVSVTPETDMRSAPRLHSVSFCGADVGWAVGDGLILHTTDGGKTWATQRSGNKEEELLSVACEDPEKVLAVGRQGLIMQSVNGGRDWDKHPAEPGVTFVRVRFFGDEGWILGGRVGKGTLLHRRSGEAKWERAQLDTSSALFDIYMNGRQGWLVGSGGLISHTTDGGQTWQRERSPTDNDLTTLFFITPQKGWAGGNKRTLLYHSN